MRLLAADPTAWLSLAQPVVMEAQQWDMVSTRFAAALAPCDSASAVHSKPQEEVGFHVTIRLSS